MRIRYSSCYIKHKKRKQRSANIMIEHVKCNCTKYSIPENDYYEPPIRVSTKKNDILIAVMSNRKNVVLHKIVKAELIYSDTIYTGVSFNDKKKKKVDKCM